jgi:hypothetical protein
VFPYELANEIAINIDEILTLHEQLFKKIKTAIEGGRGRSKRICQVFDSFKIRFIQVYTFYFQNLRKSLKWIDFISNNKNPFWEKYEKINSDCKHGNKSIKLNGIILSPFQRFTKYPILFERLIKKNATTNNQIETNEIINSTIKNLREVLFFLNQCEKDQIDIEKIDDYCRICSFDSKKYGRLLKFTEMLSGKGPLINFRNDCKKYLFLFQTQIIICNKTNGKYFYIDSLPIDEQFLVFDGQQTCKNEYELSFIRLYQKKYDFFYKVDQINEMQSWSTEITNIIEFNKQIQIQGHKFLLTNFSTNLTECFSCNKYLEGIFFQGYKCKYCLKVYHKDCLNNLNMCELNPIEESRPLSYILSISAEQVSSRKSFIFVDEVDGLPNEYIQVFKALIKHENLINDGKCLNFNENDFIFITEDLDNLKSKGFKLVFNSHAKETLQTFKHEGIFYKSHISHFDKSADLKFYSWYLECEKLDAHEILKKINIGNNSNIFMVRYDKHSNNYRITVKFNNNVIKHIKIDMKSIYGTIYYTLNIDIKNRAFTSVPDLINFFRKESLNDCTNGQVDDALCIPYREALPVPIYIAEAKADFEGKYN